MQELAHTVVNVGAGPTGLALGAELKRLGIPSLIPDRLEAGANTSRAAVVHARTLEVLEPLGVSSGLLQEGIVVPIFGVRDRNRILTSVSFKDLNTKYPSVTHGYGNFLGLGRLMKFPGDRVGYQAGEISAAGTCPYFCSIHPKMTGKVVVK